MVSTRQDRFELRVWDPPNEEVVDQFVVVLKSAFTRSVMYSSSARLGSARSSVQPGSASVTVRVQANCPCAC